MNNDPKPWNPYNNPNPAAIRRVPHPMAKPHSCPYCQSPVELVNNDVIYGGRPFGAWPYAYRCANTNKCGAYVGLHPETDIPLGTLADRETRDAHHDLKDVFNRIWQDGHKSRSDAYKWLAMKMKVEHASRDCHISLFDVKTCNQAKAICTEFLTKGKGKNYAKAT